MRPPTPRPPGEHLAVVSRVLRQITVTKTMSRARRNKILDALLVIRNELEKEIAK